MTSEYAGWVRVTAAALFRDLGCVIVPGRGFFSGVLGREWLDHTLLQERLDRHSRACNRRAQR